MRPLLFLALAASAQAAVVLDIQHADLSLNFVQSKVGTGTNPWRLSVRNEDEQIELSGRRSGFMDTLEVVLGVFDGSRITAPGSGNFSFLGPAGAPVWVLPQSQDLEALYLGVSLENKVGDLGWAGVGMPADFLVRGVPSGTFSANRVNLRLHSFSGPGNFFLYSTGAFGAPTIAMRTDDGLSAADTRQLTPAGHVHFNWAFTAPGDYELGFRANGTLTSGSTYTESDLTTFTFRVVPEPGSAALALLGLAALLRRRRAHTFPGITATIHKT